MSKKHQYRVRTEFVYRTPHFHGNNYRNYEELTQDTIFQESLYFSSPQLYKALKSEGFIFKNLEERKQLSVLKYILRMCSRCAPFGTLAAVGVGKISKLKVSKVEAENFEATLSLDFRVIKDIDQVLVEQMIPNNAVRYFTNGTILEILDKYRFIKKVRDDESETHIVVEITKRNYLKKLLKEAKLGQTKSHLAKLLVKWDYVTAEQEALEFIDMLIKEQLIISALDTKIIFESSKYFSTKLLAAKIDSNYDIFTDILELERLLSRVNQLKQGTRFTDFRDIELLIEKIVGKSPTIKSSIFRANLFNIGDPLQIQSSVGSIIEKGVDILNILTSPINDSDLSDFKNKFHARFENQKVPLLHALDPDIGIGFGPSQFERPSELLPSIVSTLSHKTNAESNLTFIHPIVLKAYQKLLSDQLNVITLTQMDFKDYLPDWEDSPTTQLAVVEIYNSEAEENALYLKLVGGNSCTNILGRFYQESPAVKEIVDKIIIQEERDLPDGTIFAEINYLPENDKLCNVLQRPPFRDKQINVFSVPDHLDNRLIPLSDLYISLDAGKNILLTSKTLKKRIIPRNTTAHNYHKSSNDTYRFLSTLFGEKNRKPIMQFSWGNLEPINGFFPRVIFEKRLILSLATWKIYREDIDFKKDFTEEMLRIKTLKQIPDKVTVGDDSGLVIDFSITLSLKILKTEFKNDFILLKEMLFENLDPVVQSNGLFFHNEILMFLNKNGSES